MKWNRAINGFLVIMILVLIAILFTCFSGNVFAKDAILEIQFSMEMPEKLITMSFGVIRPQTLVSWIR